MRARSAESVVVDIGGTNARFGYIDEAGCLSDVTILQCDDFKGFEAALDAFTNDKNYLVRSLCLSVACPVDSDHIRFTNNNWSFSKQDLFERLALDRLLVVNDFAAQSMASVTLTTRDFKTLRHGTSEKLAPILVIGPGTGLGVGGVVPDGDGAWIPLASEGGHVTLSGQTERESAVIKHLSRGFGHVSAERCISGSGLVRIYRALCEIDDTGAIVGTPQELVENIGVDSRARETLDLFASFLGTVASDACLTLGAAGGVVLAGGVIPKLGTKFPSQVFLDRFSSKGRFSSYLAKIEIRVQLNTEAALVGLANFGRFRGINNYMLLR